MISFYFYHNYFPIQCIILEITYSFRFIIIFLLLFKQCPGISILKQCPGISILFYIIYLNIMISLIILALIFFVFFNIKGFLMFCNFGLFSFFPLPCTVCLGVFVLKRLTILSLKPPTPFL